MPLHIPQAVKTAALLPRAIPWVTTNRLSGPGAKVRAMEAPRNINTVDTVMVLVAAFTALSCPLLQ
jgi:hypothetical protein